jgi:hypothetical protein
MLHLCLHASFYDLFGVGLRAFCDVSETIRHYREEINWEQIQQRIGQWGTRNCVYLTLLLAWEFVEADVPEGVLEALKPDGFDLRFVDWFKEERIFRDRGTPARGMPLSPNFAQLWGSQQLRDKALLFLKSVFPSPAILARRYQLPRGSLWIYGYYLLRPIDLFFRYGRAAWRLLRREEGMVASAERTNKETAWQDWLASG